MSNKLKITLIISIFLIIAVVASSSYIFLGNDKKINNISYNNNNIHALNDSKVENQNIITVVLNSGKTEEIQDDGQVDIKEQNNISIPAYARPSNEQEVKDIYHIKVNYLANVVTVYSKDIDGKYTIPYKAFTCSTGSATPTSGTYKTDYKYRWLGLFGNVYGQYCTRIVGNILFHSVPYLEKGNEGSLEYWEYDKLRNICICWLYKTDSIRC